MRVKVELIDEHGICYSETQADIDEDVSVAKMLTPGCFKVVQHMNNGHTLTWIKIEA